MVTNTKFALYTNTGRQFVGTWKQCMRMATKFGQIEYWYIQEDESEYIVTENKPYVS